ncbi:MAG: GMP/IMP nucleotidase [Kangiellaceae bacterium]|nr:GMP/IMP nucleotidase [Kangiellaceae bacterium]
MYSGKLPWQDIDTVLLDMDGTILDLHYDNHFWLSYIPEVYARANNLSVDDAKQHLFAQFDANRGTLDWYCIDHWSEQLGLDIAKLKHDTADKITFRPNAQRFLAYLQNQGKQVILVTNAHPKTLEVKRLNSDFHHYFSSLISTHDLGYPKEQQNLWRVLKQRVNFDPDRTLFIDDSLTILQAADTFGIKYVLGIYQPDSQQPGRTMSPFEVVNDFADIY